MNGGIVIMKAKSLLLTVLVAATGLAFLSLPAGAECWMTCPPGSTATPSATEKPATAERAASTEELTPAKKPEATAKASPAPAPAKSKAAEAPAGANVEPTASPEELTPAKKSEATAKASPTAAPTKPTAPQQFSPRRHRPSQRPLKTWHHQHRLRTQRSNRLRLSQRDQLLFQSQARCPARRPCT